jgi:hypothetical protein
MAEIWGAALATVAVGAYSANQQKQAAKGAAGAAQRSADAATNEQARQYDQSRQDMLPWLNTGTAALNQLAAIYGLNTGAPAANQPSVGQAPNDYSPPSYSDDMGGGTLRPYEGNPLGGGGGGTPSGQVGYEQGTPYTGGNALAAGQQPVQSGGAPNYNAFFDSPDYQYALGQGINALDRSAAARGRLYSGGYGQDLTKYAQGMATQNLGNYLNRLSGIAGVGQTQSNALAGIGQNYANNVGTIGMNNALAQRDSIYGQANANTNYANQLVGAFGQWYGGQNKSLNGGWYLGNQPGKG